MIERRRRLVVVLTVCVVIFAGAFYESFRATTSDQPAVVPLTTTKDSGPSSAAAQELAKLAVKGRAPKTGYARPQFGNGWSRVGQCDVRNHVLRRDMTEVKTRSDTDCTVLSGRLNDPYTAKQINFTRGAGTSDDVQIDHVVALSDAWQKGAQQLASEQRIAFANDSLNLLAVDGPANQKKSDADATTWLPPNKAYRCRYVARQIAVKAKYVLWVTPAEHDAMQRVLASCPEQSVPLVTSPQ